MPLRRAAGNVPTMKKAPSQVGSPLRGSAGFTILELLIAIAVLAIVVGIGVPSFTDAIRRNRLTSQTNSLLGGLAIARSEAVKRGTPVTICPANATQDGCAGDVQWAATGWIVFSDGEGTLGVIDADATEPNDVILQRMPAAAAQKVDIINADRTFLTYRPDGGVTMPVGTNVTLFRVVPDGCDGPEGARIVEVIAAGRASSRRATCT